MSDHPVSQPVVASHADSVLPEKNLLNIDDAANILTHAQSERIVLQNFCPLADSLEWQLGQGYLAERGNQAFIGDPRPVPFVVNNDGILSRQAAEVFFHSLRAAEQVGPLESDLFVLELGIGVGLFARYFLDALRELCWQHNKDYYERLTYIAADRSERMLCDACRHGVFVHHPGRVNLRVVDALDPADCVLSDLLRAGQPSASLRAVFLNYLLDCLPAAVLDVSGEEVRQLCICTCLARGVRLADHTDLSPQDLARRAASADPAHLRELLELYPLMASEYAYLPVNTTQLPYADFVVPFTRTSTGRLLHSHGAIRCLERLLELLHPNGMILVNDYGQTQLDRADEYEHQRFSQATFIGVNFSLLRAYFADGGRCEWIEPFQDSDRIHSRLLGRHLLPETKVRFLEIFGKAAADALDEPVQRARACIKIGRLEMALSHYRTALERQPSNWLLMNEVALFLTFGVRNLKAALDMAKAALALNPNLSAELWNTLGDALYEFGRIAEARQAYSRALQINPNDVRARYNLAWVHLSEQDHATALSRIAEALALDSTGEYRERLLQKQSEVLARLATRQQQDVLLLANRIRTTVAPPKSDRG